MKYFASLIVFGAFLWGYRGEVFVSSVHYLSTSWLWETSVDNKAQDGGKQQIDDIDSVKQDDVVRSPVSDVTKAQTRAIPLAVSSSHPRQIPSSVPGRPDLTQTLDGISSGVADAQMMQEKRNSYLRGIAQQGAVNPRMQLPNPMNRATVQDTDGGDEEGIDGSQADDEEVVEDTGENTSEDTEEVEVDTSDDNAAENTGPDPDVEIVNIRPNDE